MTISTSTDEQVFQSGDCLLADLVEEFTNRLQAGEAVDVEEAIAAHPEHAEQLRQLIPALRVLRDLSVSAARHKAAAASEGVIGSGTLGDFRILREVGRGGMGVVYEAEQISLGRRVALKVLPFASTLDPKQLQRFKNEAQAAAGLHHTNIVPVFATGSERGVHFYAMQFIEGQTLAQMIAELRQPSEPRAHSEPRPSGSGEQLSDETTAYAPPPDGRGADATPPLAVFSTERSTKSPDYFRSVAQLGVQAAEALEHAHQLGIVHRDIKPGNLLVDARGQLWITDFGLAQVQGGTNLTMSGDLLGTLRYMSPEQALAKRVAIDHRTDIYSLGVTLYELLTLEPAFGGRDRQELLRQIAFEEPKTPRRLNRGIPAELDTIVLKAIEKSPADRYATAQELADDLRRFLEDKPIRARRPSILARLRKWSWRHRGVVSATAISTVLVLAATSGIIAWKWRESENRRVRAEHAEKKAQAINDFLVKELLPAGTPEIAQGRKVTVEEVLDRAADKIDRAFPEQPEVEAVVRMAIGSAYKSMGLYAKALPHLERALAIRQEWLGEEHPDTLDTLNEISETWTGQGKNAEAERLLRQTLATARRVLGEEDRRTLQLEFRIGDVVRNQGRWDEAEALYRRCLDKQIRILSEEDHDTFETMNSLAPMLGERMGKWQEGEPLARRNLEVQERVRGQNHPNTLMARGTLGDVFFSEGKWREAEALHRQTLDRALSVFPTTHPMRLAAHHGQAFMLFWLDERLDEAESLFHQAVAGWPSPDHPEALITRTLLSYTLLARGKLDEAQREFSDILAVRDRTPGLPHESFALAGLGLVLQERGKWAEAEDTLRQAVAGHRRALPGHFLTLRAVSRLAVVLDVTGKHDQATKLFRDVLEAWRKNFPLDHPERAFTLSDWAEHLMAEGEFNEAKPALIEALDIENSKVPQHRRIGQTLCALGWLQAQTGRAKEGEQRLREGLKICQRAWPADHWLPGDAESRLGGCLTALAKYEDAEKLLLSSYETLEKAAGTPPQRRVEALDRIVKLYETRDKADQAAAWRAKRPSQPKPPEEGAGCRKDK
jgi:serine/threonine protein kinase